LLAAASLSPFGFAPKPAHAPGAPRHGRRPRVTAKGRAKPATLIVANNVPYVIDCGDGVALAIRPAPVSRSTPCAMSSSPITTPTTTSIRQPDLRRLGLGLRTPLDAYGPPPLKGMTEAWFQLNRFDIETRIADEGRIDLRKLVTAHEFSENGPVMQNADVKVTAARDAPSADRASLRLPFRLRDRAISSPETRPFRPSWSRSPRAPTCWSRK